jgi:pimeloyl-ACP methyl ester carboxylesterase
MVDGVPMSALVAAVQDPRAVIVAIHGGATTSAYFDCPGHPRLSLLRKAASQGYTTVALDRPGYGMSALYADEMTQSERRVALAFGVLDKVVGADRGAGLFMLGHSAGCELALRMTIDERANALGVEIAGTGTSYAESTKEVMRHATATHRPAGLRDMLWQPLELYPPEVLNGSLSAPGVAYEAEVTANWPRRDFAAVAAEVRVPVGFSVAAHERVWDTTPEAREHVASLFTASPRVVVNEVADAGHNLSVALSAESYHQTVLSFVEECVAFAEKRVS